MELWLSNNVDDDWIIRINENKTILSLLSHNSKELRVIPKISLTSPFTIIRDSSRIFQRYSTLNEMTTRFYAVIWRRQNTFFDIKKEGKKLKKVNVQRAPKKFPNKILCNRSLLSWFVIRLFGKSLIIWRKLIEICQKMSYLCQKQQRLMSWAVLVFCNSRHRSSLCVSDVTSETRFGHGHI